MQSAAVGSAEVGDKLSRTVARDADAPGRIGDVIDVGRTMDQAATGRGYLVTVLDGRLQLARLDDALGLPLREVVGFHDGDLARVHGARGVKPREGRCHELAVVRQA